MKYAIDRLYGYDREIEASDDLYHHSKYFCPECGENVHLRRSSGNKAAYFAHNKKTDYTPECEKRVDGIVSVSLSERLGLPLYLVKDTNKFKIYISFPAVGEKELELAYSNNAKLTINNTYSVAISSSIFYDDTSTLLPVDFIPQEGRYEIQYIKTEKLNVIQRKWATYAEAFVKNGAIFSVSSIGCKKLKSGDSLILGKEYYYFCKSENLPYLNHKEIDKKYIGTLKVRNKTYSVYSLKINVKNDSNRTRIINIISDDLYNMFGVRLNEASSELIPLWPPMIDTDVFTPIFDSRVTAYVSSPSVAPNVFFYRNGASSPIRESHNEKIISVPYFSKEITYSVDRKYIGREKTIVKNKFDIVGHEYQFDIVDKDGNALESSNDQIQFKKDYNIRFNSKIDLFVQTNDKKQRKISVRNILYPMESFSAGDQLYFFADDYLAKFLELKRAKSLVIKKDVSHITNMIRAHKYGEYVLVPVRINKMIRQLKKNKNYDIAIAIERSICNSKIQIGLVNYLDSVREEIINE